jgi:hypothetical protein
MAWESALDWVSEDDKVEIMFASQGKNKFYKASEQRRWLG